MADKKKEPGERSANDDARGEAIVRSAAPGSTVREGEADKAADGERQAGGAAPTAKWVASVLGHSIAFPAAWRQAVLLTAVLMIGLGIYGWVLAGTQVPVPRLPPNASAAEGYCYELSLAGSKLSVIHGTTALALTAIVIICGSAAVVLAAEPANRILLLSVVIVTGLGALYMFKRADAAAELAAAGSNARLLAPVGGTASLTANERVMHDTCAKAWTEWLKSRSDANAIARAALEESLKGVRQSSSDIAAKAASAQPEMVDVVGASKDIHQDAESLQKLLAAMDSATPPSTIASAKVLAGNIKDSSDKSQKAAESASKRIKSISGNGADPNGSGTKAAEPAR